MAGDNTDLLANVPSISEIMDLYHAPPAQAPQGGTGTIMPGLQSGWYGTKAAVAQGLQEGARALGANETADSLAGYAKGQRDIAASYANPELEKAGWLDPRGFAYHMAQAVPGIVGGLGGAAAATLALPETAIGALGGAALTGARALMGAGALGGMTAAEAGTTAAGMLGGAAATYPMSVGDNAQRALDEGQPESPGKALALGVPEALVQGVMPGLGEGWLAGRMGSSLASKMAQAGIANAGAGAAGEALMQQMGDPNRTFAERSQQIINAALSGLTQGAAFGGVIHAFAKKPAAQATNDDLLKLTGPEITNNAALTGPPAPAGLLEPPHRFPPSPDTEPQPPKAFSGETITADASPDQVPPFSNVPMFANVPKAPEPANVPPAPGERGAVVTPELANVPPAPGERGDVAQPPEPANVPPATGPRGTVVTPELANVPPAVGERGDVTQPPIPAQTSGAREAVAAAQTETIKKVTRGFIPDFLKPHLGDTDGVQGALYNAAKKRLDAQKAPFKPSDIPDILGSRLTKIAQAFDVLDKDNNLVDPRPKADEPIVDPPAEEPPGPPPAATTSLGPETEPDPEQGNAVPPKANRPDLDPSWSTSRQNAWKQAEKLRAQVPDDPAMQHLHDKLNEVQSSLVNPGKGGIAKAVGAIRDVREAIDGHKAIEATKPVEAGAEQPPVEKPAAPLVDETKGAQKFDTPPEKPDAVQEPSPAPVDDGKSPGDGSGVREGNDQAPTGEIKPQGGAEVASPPVKEPTPQEKLKAAQGRHPTLAEVKARDPGENGPFDPSKPGNYVRNHAFELGKPDAERWGASKAAQIHNASKLLSEKPKPGEELPPVKEAKPTGRPSNEQGPQAKEAAPKPAKLDDEHAKPLAKALSGLRKNIIDLNGTELPAKTTKAVRAAFEQGMAKLTAQHDAIIAAVKSADPYAALKQIKDDHFSSQAFDDAYDAMPKNVRNLLDENNQHIDNVLDQIHTINDDSDTSRRISSPDEMFASRKPTQMDRDIAYLINQGHSSRSILQYIVKNGTSSIRRTIAARLLQLSKADPRAQLETQDKIKGNRVLAGSVYGDYHTRMDRIRIGDLADAEHTFIHEFTHAATVRALSFNKELRASMTRLMQAAYDQATELERKHYAFTNVKEFVAEAFANSHFAKFLDGLDPPKGARELPGSTIWRSFKELVRRTFGFPKGAETMLDHVMHLAGEVIHSDNEARATSVQGVEKLTSTINRLKLDAGDDILKRAERALDPGSIPTRIFNKLLPWRTLESIRDSIQHLVPTMAPYVQHVLDRKLREEAFNGFVTTAANMGRALPKEARDLVNKLMTYDMIDIDPRRALSQHTWMDAAGKAKVASKVAEANKLWNDAKRQGLDKVYEAHNQSNRAHLFSLLTGSFRDLVQRDKLKITLKADPFDVFASDKSGMRTDPRRSSDFWQQRLNNSLSVARQYISHIKNEIDTTQDLHTKAALNEHIEAISSWERDATRLLTASNQAPNFAFRRRGDHFVAAKLAKNFSPQQMEQLHVLLKRSGFDNVQLEPNNENRSIYIRTFGQDRASALRDVMIKAEQGAILEKGTIKSGPSSTLRDTHGVAPAWISRQIRNMRDTMPDLPPGSDPELVQKYNDAIQHSMDQMTQQYLDLLPDSNIGKMFAEREGVQGADTDMMRAFEERALNASRGVANLSMSGRMADAHKQMIKDVENVKNNTSMTLGQQGRAHAAVGEVFLREAQRNWQMPQTMFDGIRRMTHLFELGISVPYVLTLGSQVPTLTIPELGKHFGFAKSILATAKVMPLALKVMQATFSGYDKWAFAMTPDKLKGLSQKDRDFLIHQNNRGDFNVSSFTQHIYDGLHHTDPTMRKLHEVSGAWTLYAEMFPRLVTALAARDLHEANPKSVQGKSLGDLHQFVSDKVNRSQFSWLSDTNPRATGKHGVAGAASPLIAQFQNFHIKMVEKLHREFSDAFGARGGEYKSEARRFLLGHLAAQVAVAGTMGLPAVGMAAGVYDRLADWAGDNNTHDIRASYRKYLSDMMGNDVGEAMAHGLSRYAGIDMSEHLGEDRILPLTQLMVDKRKLEDSYGDWMKSLAGSAAHLGLNMMLGARDIANGDTLEGMTKILPEALRNMAEAKLISEHGYEDKSGFLKPIKVEDRDVIEKFLGLTPAKEANYGEKQRIVSGLREREEYDKQNILTHLAKAYNRHDPQGYQQWMQESQQFMLTHPGQPPPASGFGDYLTQNARSAALAGATGTPKGVSPRDFNARGAVNYGNMQGN